MSSYLDSAREEFLKGTKYDSPQAAIKAGEKTFTEWVFVLDKYRDNRVSRTLSPLQMAILANQKTGNANNLEVLAVITEQRRKQQEVTDGVLAEIRRKPGVSPVEVQSRLSIPRSRLGRILDQLKRANLVRSEGNTRNTVLFPVEDL